MWFSLRDRWFESCSDMLNEWVAVRVSHSVSGHASMLAPSQMFVVQSGAALPCYHENEGVCSWQLLSMMDCQRLSAVWKHIHRIFPRFSLVTKTTNRIEFG